MATRFEAGEVITAMVTPFTKDGDVDYDKAAELASYLMENGTDSVIVAATTGECPTLTHEEEVELLSTVKRAVKNDGKVIMGAGSNSTEEAIKYAKVAEKEGADAILSVVPYYNKPSQEGMKAHFAAVAQAVKIPVIIYNIPSRTGVDMEPETVKYLAEKFENIVGIKQSSSDLDKVSEMRDICPEDFEIYCGDDSLTLPMLALGAKGVVSVASHLYGDEIKCMIEDFKSGQVKSALNMHMILYPMFKKLFMAPNPVPVKAALSKLGIIKDYVRLPLVILNYEQKAELFALMDTIEKE
ncbi:4-hydroxy-tetrahydrodipicolinate synthase [bacterium]|nr:4-hydroxy-tetrahydrodipicolinate synthase [bacterium]